MLDVQFSKDDVRRMANVMLHFADGGRVELIRRGPALNLSGSASLKVHYEWEPCPNPSWDWLEYDYRIVESWRTATVEDAVKAIRGNKVKARYRDNYIEDWNYGFLSGYDASLNDGEPGWLFDNSEYAHVQCEVSE